MSQVAYGCISLFRQVNAALLNQSIQFVISLVDNVQTQEPLVFLVKRFETSVAQFSRFHTSRGEWRVHEDQIVMNEYKMINKISKNTNSSSEAGSTEWSPVSEQQV